MNDEINVLKLTLHGRLAGYLAGYQNGRNVLSFADDYKENRNRPTLSKIVVNPRPIGRGYKTGMRRAFRLRVCMQSVRCTLTIYILLQGYVPANSCIAYSLCLQGYRRAL